MRAIVKEVTGYDSANVKVKKIRVYLILKQIVQCKFRLSLTQNIYQCVEETEYVTDGTASVPNAVGKVEQIGPSVSSAKSAKSAVPQMVSVLQNQFRI